MTLNYIYKITNLVNGKIYIGQTTYTIECRWKQHICASSTNPDKKDYNFLLHKAIRKYGKDNFSIELLEEVPKKEDLSSREMYWIDFYKSCILEEENNGYNMTYGGEGASKINKQEIYSLWDEELGSIKIAKSTGHSISSIKKVLETYSKYSKEVDFARNTGKTVYQFNENGELLNSFPSIASAARYVNINSSIINKCCHGQKQSAAGFFWSFNPTERFSPRQLKTWQSYRIAKYTLDGDFICEYPSLKAAIESLNKKQPKYIKECCEGKRENMYGYIWKYVDKLAVTAKEKKIG